MERNVEFRELVDQGEVLPRGKLDKDSKDSQSVRSSNRESKDSQSVRSPNKYSFSAKPNLGTSFEYELGDEDHTVFTIEGKIAKNENRSNNKKSFKYFGPKRESINDSSNSSQNSSHNNNQENGNNYNGQKKVTYERPQSTYSRRKENTIRGPTYYYKAKETYFECEFYIYGHKYQCKLCLFYLF